MSSPTLSPEHSDWIRKQKMFFVATAPMKEDGHVNCSPKGLDSFRIINETTVAYQDLVGSGVETIAHIRDNKRVTIMFCAFEGPPKILRIYGEGEVILPSDEKFSEFQNHFPLHAGTRSFIVVHVQEVSSSCGYSVPVYEFKQHRDVLDKWVDRKGEDGIRNYISENNKLSLDGLPGID